MKSLYTLMLLLFSCQCTFAQVFNWAYNIGGANSDKGTALATDASGNVYTAGVCNGTINFTSSSPSSPLTITNSGVIDDIYFAKYAPNGECMWGRFLGSPSMDYINDIVVDAGGNVYITGSFRGDTMDFDPGPGSAVLNNTTLGGESIYLAKYDAGGNYVWAQSISGSSGTTGKALELDASGNIYLSGTFSGSNIDFDQGTGVDALTSAGFGTDIFVSKYDNNGNHLWAIRVGGVQGEPYGGICVDNSGNVYLTAGFYGTVDFDPGSNTANLTAAGGPDAFIACYDPVGNYVWAQRYGGTGVDKGVKICTDGAHLYLCGTFAGTVSLGSTSLTASSYSSWFLGTTDMNGNFSYAGQLPVYNIYNMSVSPGGKLLLSGNIDSQVDVDLSAAVANIAPSGTFDAFVVQYNNSWGYEWGGTIGGYALSYGYDAVADIADHVWVTGSMSDWIDCDMDPNNVVMVTTFTGMWGASADAFLAAYDGGILLSSELLSFNALPKDDAVYLHWEVAGGTQHTRYEVQRSADAVHFQTIGTVAAGTGVSVQQAYDFNDQQPLSGTSYYRIAMTGKDGTTDYSHTVKISGVINTHFPMFYPNPTEDRVAVKFQSTVQSATLRITDMQGRVLCKQNIQLSIGENVISADLTTFTAGIYKLSISDEYGKVVATGNVTRK